MIAREICAVGVWCGVKGDPMPNYVDFAGRPFHFLGIGGIGMSALAYVLAKRNLPVSGSDLRPSHITQRLESVGAHIFRHQDAENLEFFQKNKQENKQVQSAVVPLGASSRTSLESASSPVTSTVVEETLDTRHLLPQVICSTAIQTTNTEYKAAIDLGCPIFHRSDLLAALIQNYRSIAVAGTHGKTTTSSLIGYVLWQAGIDPTIVVGGEVDAWEGNARLGDGPFLVAEADESDGSLVKLSAEIGVVTNIELDHPDHYQSLEDVIDTFKHFADRCQILVGCIDCPTVQERLKPTLSYSLDPDTGADYTVKAVQYRADGTHAEVWERGEKLGELQLRLLGKHNLSNALAAIAVARSLKLDFDAIAAAIATFTGAKRRFEVRGQAQGICFVDDYAHHPSELRATLSAARLQREAGAEQREGAIQRIVAVFQPHRYSRTQAFLSEFATSFQDADLVVLTDIYSAGEANLGTVKGQDMADAIARHQTNVFYQPTLAEVRSFLKEILQPGDLCIFLGAGNLNQSIPEVISYFQPPTP